MILLDFLREKWENANAAKFRIVLNLTTLRIWKWTE